ncbi:TetR/AcrR family transcriptional regulator [Mycobacterium sp. HNNTM2301]|uniref:TetR/AcrR family transcriptional regulator n=1 Tax=Mycobacterium hainanense TaxID=3289775 RepID=UPI0035A7282A
MVEMVDHGPDALTYKGRMTRDRIITRAAELALVGGFSRLSIESIRKAALVSGSQMTHYFPCRDALIRAVIAHQTEVILQFHRQSALRGLETFEDFDRWAELTLRFGRSRSRRGAVPHYGVLVCEIATDEQARRLLADGYRQWQAVLRDGLERMVKRKYLVAETDTGQLASVLIGSHQGADALTLALGRSWPVREALAFGLSYLHMFATDPTQRRSHLLAEYDPSARRRR